MTRTPGADRLDDYRVDYIDDPEDTVMFDLLAAIADELAGIHDHLRNKTQHSHGGFGSTGE